MDPYAKAKAELSEIDSRIAALQSRKAELRQFIELAERLFSHGSYAVATAPANQRDIDMFLRGPAAPLRDRDSTAKARILTACKAYIIRNGHAHTPELVEALMAQGVEISGTNKNNTISVYLSKSEEFQNDRRLGWSLRQEPKEMTPQGASTPAGSVVDDGLDLA